MKTRSIWSSTWNTNKGRLICKDIGDAQRTVSPNQVPCIYFTRNCAQRDWSKRHAMIYGSSLGKIGSCQSISIGDRETFLSRRTGRNDVGSGTALVQLAAVRFVRLETLVIWHCLCHSPRACVVSQRKASRHSSRKWSNPAPCANDEIKEDVTTPNAANSDGCCDALLDLTLSFLRVINYKFSMQPEI